MVETSPWSRAVGRDSSLEWERSAPPDADGESGLARWPDLTRIGGLLGGAALSLLAPQSLDAAWTGFLNRASQRVFPHAVKEISLRMRAALPVDSGFDPEAAARAFWLMRVEDSWGRARGLRPFAWKPRVRIEGLDRLDAALGRGRGAVLWGMRLGSATALKQAFYHAGRPLVHLSRAQHGSPTATRLGICLAAPLYCRAENPYLRERVVIPLDGSPRYLQTLRQRLHENACLSIFGEHPGRQNVVRPVLTASFEFAVGAPSLAWTEGAALLTVSAHREAPLSYRVEIDEEIPVERSISRKEFAERAVGEFARRLESKIVRTPSDWQGWAYQRFRSGGRS